MKTTKIIGILAIISILMGAILSACGAGAPAAPTTDPGMVYTMAAATVQAQLTQAALANPTPEPPTATPEPSPTLPPTAEPTVEVAMQPTVPFTANVIEPTVPASGLNPNLAPTQSQAQAAGFQVGDVAEFQYNIPADNTVYNPGIRFMGEVGFKNVGSVTWTTDYKLVFVGGAQFSGITEVPLSKAVKPGEKAIFNIAFAAPSTPNDETTKWYLSYWRLVTQTGAPVAKGDMYFKIIVNRE